MDPLAVPIPPGTEVTTRVDRAHGDRVVQQGAVGRVAALDGDHVDVEVVGVGRVRYLRSELVPRKLGLVRYARRRADAWSDLAPTVVLDAIVGSRAWGLDHAGSDEDHRGIFVLPMAWTTGLADPPLDLQSLDGSAAYWEVGKAIRQALRADPNTLEMLFAADASAVRDPMGAMILEIRDAFVSQEIYGAFGRYALSQLERLEHNQRLADHRALVLAWLVAEPTLDLDTVAVRLAASAQVPGPTSEDAQRRARDYLKQLYRSLYDAGHLATAEWASLLAFARDQSHNFEPPRDLRPKNAYNLIRLLDLATRWLAGGSPELRVRDELRPQLLAIKGGQVPMPDVVALAQSMTPALEAARASSPLPKHADIGRVESVLRAIRAESARRSLAAAPGPWGAEAPPPPIARFD
ncbi:MAG TPA: nucleotidyltransferase domain-containing protein [Kofleriaceae bacterium]|nr:nucleotidyltransferase domain-containing protein [Kofleriaceae bacterium]